MYFPVNRFRREMFFLLSDVTRIFLLISLSPSTLLNSFAVAVESQLPHNHKTQPRILSVEVACSQNALLGRVHLRDPFWGVLHALGHPHECRSLGNGTTEMRIAFTADRCGTKVTQLPDGRPHYEVLIYLQFDAKMQQAADETLLLKCSPRDVVVRGSLGPANKDHKETPNLPQMTRRSKFEGWVDILMGRMPTAYPIVKPVHVGEELTMLVKIRHPAEVYSKVLGCLASDGTDKNTKQMIDSKGCSVNPEIMPNLKENYIQRTGIKMAYASFVAFKFPTRNSLHLRCQVIICNGTCPSETCERPQWSVRRRARGAQTSSLIIEQLLIHNSVEVVEHDLPSKKSLKTAASKEQSGSSVPAKPPDGTMCLSSTRLVALFGFLLGILLVSLVVTICMCVKAKELRRRLLLRQTSFPYGRVSQCS